MRKIYLLLAIVVLGLFINILLKNNTKNTFDNISEPKFKEQSSKQKKEYIFAIHPLHNPERLFQVYGPLIDYINKNIKTATFRLEASRNYEEFDKKLYARVPEFALPNPYQTLNSLKHGYHVIAKMGDDHKFTGVILVRTDSNINKISDLKGKKISYPSSMALAACIMPQYYLYTHGIDINHDIVNLYVGSQESSIMNVYLGYVSAGVTWPIPWEAFQKEHPEKAQKLKVKWETEPMLNNGVVVRDDVPSKIAQQVAHLLNTLHKNNIGLSILSRMPLSRFELADDDRYQVIEKFLKTFSKNVRTLEEIKE